MSNNEELFGKIPYLDNLIDNITEDTNKNEHLRQLKYKLQHLKKYLVDNAKKGVGKGKQTEITKSYVAYLVQMIKEVIREKDEIDPPSEDNAEEFSTRHIRKQI